MDRVGIRHQEGNPRNFRSCHGKNFPRLDRCKSIHQRIFRRRCCPSWIQHVASRVFPGLSRNVRTGNVGFHSRVSFSHHSSEPKSDFLQNDRRLRESTSQLIHVYIPIEHLLAWKRAECEGFGNGSSNLGFTTHHCVSAAARSFLALMIWSNQRFENVPTRPNLDTPTSDLESNWSEKSTN